MLEGFILGFFRLLLGAVQSAGATAEWCEHDPKEVVVMANGQHRPFHLFVTVRTADRHHLLEWDKKSDLWVTTDIGAILVAGPPCVYRTWAEDRKTHPFKIWGDEFRLYSPHEVAIVEVEEMPV
jgi:hypothetical protein